MEVYKPHTKKWIFHQPCYAFKVFKAVITKSKILSKNSENSKNLEEQMTLNCHQGLDKSQTWHYAFCNAVVFWNAIVCSEILPCFDIQGHNNTTACKVSMHVGFFMVQRLT